MKESFYVYIVQYGSHELHVAAETEELNVLFYLVLIYFK